MRNFGSGLLHMGVVPTTHVAIFSMNRPEWTIVEHSCYMYNFITIPIHDQINSDAIEHILNITQTPILVTTAKNAATIFQISDKLIHLKTVILIDSIPKIIYEQARTTDITLLTMRDVEKKGRDKPLPKKPATKETIATICFTSGTTGLPEGAILTHGNLLSFVASYANWIENDKMPSIDNTDSHLSYLPLAHVFERIIQQVLTHFGGRIGFYCGDISKLLDDAKELKPTIFSSVPMMYNKLHRQIWQKVKAKGGLGYYFFQTAVRKKEIQLVKGKFKDAFWDKVVFNHFKPLLGGKIRFMICGAAPISEEVQKFIAVCFSVPFIQGYGQTETSGVSSMTYSDDTDPCHVGVPVGSCHIKLRDVSSMNYTTDDIPFPRGEICVKGTNIFQGYYKDTELTNQVITPDGWCKTGDIGMWDQHGRLVVIDRIKQYFEYNAVCLRCHKGSLYVQRN
jgi:long-chain acyl-CoA synthetase